MIPRPVRCNNPGDLERGQIWQGLMHPADMSPDQTAETRFAVFREPAWGFRALAVLLWNYQHIYNCKTVYDFISKFAPTTENNTQIYAEFVADRIGRHSRDPLDVSVRATMFAVCKAVATEETGSWAPYWTDAELNAGLDRTGYWGKPAELAA